MKNKILIILCLISSFPLFTSAPAPKVEQEKGQNPEVAQAEQQEKEEKCVICLETLRVVGKPTKTLHCQSQNQLAIEHTFHTACIDRWLAGNPRCPICRTAVPQNEMELVNLLNQANSPDTHINERRIAQRKLGDMYRRGNNGIAKDFARAVEFYNQAKQADAPINVQRNAKFGLGEIYRVGGDGIAQDLAQAEQFYNQVNQANTPINLRSRALIGLGEIYRVGGNGRAKNLVRAAEFYNQANNPDAAISVQRDAQRGLELIPGSGCIVQ